MSRRVIIVGGGLAGIAASSALADRGFDTTLIERRPYLGGRATSFEDPQTGCLLDNCQHVLLGCCTNLLHLYERLGIRQNIEFFDRVHFADQTGRRGDIYATCAPSPLHLAWAMARFPLLSLPEKLELAQAMAAMRMLGDEGRNSLEGISFEQFLRDLGQSPRVIERFWNVMLVSALNEGAQTASAKYGIALFQQAFLGHRDGYRMALPVVPLAQLYEKAAVGRPMVGRRVTGLLEERGRVAGVLLPDGQPMRADHVILAAAPDAARRSLTESLLQRDPRLRALEHLQFSPIVGVHFWYDRPLLDVPHLALVGTQLQWLFRKSDDGRHLHGVISAAGPLVDQDQEQLAALFDREIRQVLPAARDARLGRCLVIKEKRATFRPMPGTDALRPTQRTVIPGLVLAGDYTRTDWPATMEGAVRSGYLAAEVVLRAEGRQERILRPDLA